MGKNLHSMLEVKNKNARDDLRAVWDEQIRYK